MTRTVAAVALWLVATVATIVVIGAGWTTLHVQREAGFVELASTLGDDAEVQRTAATLAGEAFADQSGVPIAFHEQVAGLVRESILRLTEAEGWSDAWRQTAQRTHQRLFAGLTPNDVRVDVAPLVSLALDETTADLPFELSRPDELLVTVSQEDPAGLVRTTSRSAEFTVIAGGAGVIAALLALAVARRRSTMVAALGAGAVMAAGVWWALGRVVVPRAIEARTSATAYGRALDDVLVDRIAGSLDATLLWVAAAGAALVVVGALTRAVRF